MAMQDLDSLVARAVAAVAAAADRAALEALRVEYLGKKGSITEQLKSLGTLSAADKPAAGARINAAKVQVHEAIEARRAALESAELDAALAGQRLDVTLAGRGQRPGVLHPVSRTLQRVERLF